MTEPQAYDIQSAACPIVGVGASAGGLTALQSLFEALPSQPNVAIVVVLHLPPGRPSSLDMIIGNWARLPVHAALDGVHPEVNRIYVPSPDDLLTIEAGVFRTRRAEDGGCRPGIDTIDAFLESLALDRGSSAMAVILSGTGMDGTAGAVRIRQAGGVVLVQDPMSALHDNMPNAVISRGIADYVLPVGAIARQLIACSDASYVRPESTVDATAEVSRTLNRLLELVRHRAGFDFRGYKPSPLLWRIQQRMDVRLAARFDDYLALLEDDTAELEALVRSLPIHVTEFFRDPPAWEVLDREVLEPLFVESHEAQPIKTWTPACSTGEEAYSLAMLLTEHVRSQPAARDFQVFATDASPEIVARASRGVYSEKALRSLSAERKAAFFYAADGALRVKRALREKMVFAPQDLLADPPFTALDLVTCRNLLIYLEPDAAKRVVFMLHYSALRLGGHLFLGRGESLSTRQTGFERVSSEWNIYRKVGPVAETGIRFSVVAKRMQRSAVPEIAHRAAVEHFDLPSVLVDERLQVLRIYGDTKNLLRLPSGLPTQNLVDLVPSELVLELREGAKAALAAGGAVNVNGLSDPETGKFTMSLRLTPLQMTANGASARLLISFVREQDIGQPDHGSAESSSTDAGPAERRSWSEAVRISHEELEASRAELQALNEELKASNDQLNIANQDLNQANVRLAEKVTELETQSRVLSSGAVMTLFLDEELKVRWFTPAVSELYPLLPRDAGRRITDFVPRIDDTNFLDDARGVMRSGELREAEVRHTDGRWFQRGIRPYRPEGEGRSGVAVTFADITVRKHAEEVLRDSEERQMFLLKLSDALRPLADPVAIKSVATRLLGEHVAVNRVFYADAYDGRWHVTKGYEQNIEPLPDVPFETAAYGQWTIEKLSASRRLVVTDVNSDPRFSESERRHHVDVQIGAEVALPLQKNGELVAMLVAQVSGRRDWREQDLALMEEAAERTWSAVERARVEVALRESEELRRIALKSVGMGTWRWNTRDRTVRADKVVRSLWGLLASEQPHPISHYADLMYPEGAAWLESVMTKEIAPGEEFHAQVQVASGPTSSHWVQVRGRAERDRPWVIDGISFDITEQKLADERLRESQQRLTRLIEGLPIGIGLTDANGEVTLANAAFRELVPERIPSRDEKRLPLWRTWADGRPLDKSEFPGERALRGEDVLGGIEMLYGREGERQQWKRVTSVPLRNEHGRVVGTISAIVDIDLLKRS